MLHLTECRLARPYWDMVFTFTHHVLGDPEPVKRPEAIALNMWGRGKIGSESACAFVRHAYSAFYRDFTLVDTDNRKFIAVETFRHAMYSYRSAVMRYGESIRRFKIKRCYTHEKKKKHVPKEALLRFKELIGFDESSYRHSLTPAFQAAIKRAEAAVDTYHASRRQQRRQ